MKKCVAPEHKYTKDTPNKQKEKELEILEK